MKILLLFIIIFIIIIIIFMFNNKIKIKWRTFKGKGFRPLRGNFGLYVYCGKQGTGKTYSLVEYLLDNKEDICVFNNIADIQNLNYIHFVGFEQLLAIKKILDYDYKNIGDLYHYIYQFPFFKNKVEDIVNLLVDYEENNKQLIITYDEVFTEIIKGSKLGKEVIDFLCQMRKRKIIFLTTAQEWAELPLSFRRFCRYEIDCRMIPFFKTGFLIKSFKDAEHMKWSQEEQEHIAPLLETTVTKTRQFIANSYDTFLRISSVVVPTTTTVEKNNNNEFWEDLKDDDLIN